MSKKLIKQFNEKASWLRKGVICHRGKHGGDVKENTLDAFKLAIEDNLGIELDVRLSKDMQVVVFHDSSLKRIFGVNKNVEECTYEEIKGYTNNEVPLLKDVLSIVNDNVGLMIEIKSTKVGKLEEKVYEILKDYKGRYVIMSFNPLTLKYFYKKDSSIIRGQLACCFKKSDYNFIFRFVLKRMWFNFLARPHFISYGIEDCNYKLLQKYRKKGYFIIGWTYNNEKNKLKLKTVYDNMIMEDLSIKEF